ncbi:hypothetical protein Z948_1218 [Sulfitobacter donghicola DSW-25 = KCTC 12864 = JCM 14565]|nr:hypothetical protein Z948_1218 [Sulfitobacter donghicola DSW-25 = KCTC 12864 = JCM 14565]
MNRNADIASIANVRLRSFLVALVEILIFLARFSAAHLDQRFRLRIVTP